jgi:hypothetical protein
VSVMVHVLERIPLKAQRCGVQQLRKRPV